MDFDLSTIDLQHRAIAIGRASLSLVLGWLFAAWAGSAVRRASEYNQRVSPTLVPLFAKLTRLSLVLVVVVAALDKLGIQTSGISAGLGAAGLALGLTLKDAVSDVAAGVVLLVLRPFDVGEAVDIGGTGGVVSAIDILQTKLTSFDGVPVVLNNSAVRTAIIQNYSRAQTRCVDLEIGIGYADDIGKAKIAIEAVLAAEPRVLLDPARRDPSPTAFGSSCRPGLGGRASTTPTNDGARSCRRRVSSSSSAPTRRSLNRTKSAAHHHA